MTRSPHGGEPSGPDLSPQVSADPYRQIRTARWMALGLMGLQFFLYEPSLGAEFDFSRWWAVPLAVPLALVNLMEADLYRPQPRLARSTRTRLQGLRTIEYVGVAVECMTCLTLIALFAGDPLSALWAIMMLPIIDAGIRYRLRGALFVWLISGIGYVAISWWASHTYPSVQFMVDSLTFRIGITFVTAWTTGQLANHLMNRMGHFRELHGVARATQSFMTMSVMEIAAELERTTASLGFSSVHQIWRETATDPWVTSMKVLPRGTPTTPVALEDWTNRLVAAARGHTGVVVLHDGDPDFPMVPFGVRPFAPTSLPVEPPGPGSRVMALMVAVEGTVRLVSVVRSGGPVSPPTVTSLEVLLLHGASAMINTFQQHQHSAITAQLEHQAAHDALTMLPNRASLTEIIEEQLGDGTRPLAVMLLDLDRFKEINDTLGHRCGDQLLVEVANRLTGVLREGVVARLGGDEFGVVISGLESVADAEAVAFGLVDVVQRPVHVEGISLDVDVSVGVAVAPQHGTTPYELLRCADIAMYQAKRAQGEVALYDPDLDEHSPERLTLLGDLRRSLNSDSELHLAYQPLVNLADGTVVAVEALLRWQHPARGLVMPADFVGAAENTGLVSRLTGKVLRDAIAQVAAWREQGVELPVSVNVSPRCVLDASLPDQIGLALAEHGVPGRLLHLEITEDALIADPTLAVDVLAHLSGAGVEISIDDFGTGYSSLSYLRNLPVDELKVDKSFVVGLGHLDSDAVLVRSIVELGRNLGLRVVAEGVETPEALDRLRGFGCDVVQGYLLARPMSAERLTSWMADGGARDLVVTPAASPEQNPFPTSRRG